MKDVTFGQYYPVSSPVHRLNATVKILLSIAYIVAVFLVGERAYYGFILTALFVIGASAMSRVPFLKVLGSIKAVLFFVVLSSVLQIFFNTNGQTLLSWWVIRITDEGLKQALFITLRITMMVAGTSLLTLTTTPVELSDGIETLLAPLKIFKFPAHEFAMVMSIALRFIPTLLEETERIIKAQKARGANFESGGLLARAKALVPVLIPLLISAFRRADELADAMESRCYAGAVGRTRYKKQALSYRDAVAFILTAGLIAGVILLNGYVLA